jgi:hypothetical protein
MSDSPTDSAKPILWTNLITLFGLLLVASGVVLLVTFWVFMWFSGANEENQYVNIIGFMILPGVLIAGLILCPLGIAVRKFRIKYLRMPRTIPVKYALAFLAVTFFLILPILGVSGYQGYHYTESTEFCGTCHQVMEPQFARHKQSSHARVTCAECHVGSGAGPFVESKLSGVRQVYKVATDTYPRPVPPAITELRPARYTCEHCHWPERFFGSQLSPIIRYAQNEQNTRHEYQMLVHVGGKNEELGRAEGIHMHMLDNIEYIAADDHLQEIPWVRYTNHEGEVVVFRSDRRSSSDPPPAGNIRTVDCIDCHNLSGHDFPSPQRAIDQALEVEMIDPTLPYIKHQAVVALVRSQSAATTEEAHEHIAQSINAFYQERYPAIWEQGRKSIDQAIEGIRSAFDTSFYPHMKVDWKTYPNNIGHLESPGCFRCHDGQHVNDDGLAITTDCMSCHSFFTKRPEQGGIMPGPFEHPMKIHNLWEGLGVHNRMLCTDCHDGGLKAMGVKGELDPETEDSACGDCHSSGRWLEIKTEIDRRLNPLAPGLYGPETQPAGPSGPTTSPSPSATGEASAGSDDTGQRRSAGGG